MTEQEACRIARAAIDRGEWFEYVNPVMDLRIKIQRSLIGPVARAIGRDALFAAGAIAGFARPHIARLRNLSIGQSEGFLERPLRATWHVLFMDGESYLADRKFYPYSDGEEAAGILDDTRQRRTIAEDGSHRWPGARRKKA